MLNFKKILFVLILSNYISFANGTSKDNLDYKIDVFNPLDRTPDALIIDNLSKPKDFNKNNNLTRKTGSFNVAVGEPLYIKGTIIDAFKIPIEGAIVKIWQTNAAGRYHSLLNKGSRYFDKHFIMSGESITNNMGQYSFITIFPGYYDDRSPHINVIISHKKFGIIETEIYFDGHFRNETDPIYLTYPEKDKKMLTATMQYVDKNDITKGKIATFNIIMDGIHQYKRF